MAHDGAHFRRSMNRNVAMHIRFKIRGWVVLILLALPLLDALSLVAAQTPKQSSRILLISLVGFLLGAGLGVVVSIKIKRQAWWSSCRWAIFGLLGYCLLAFLLFAAVLKWPQFADSLAN